MKSQVFYTPNAPCPNAFVPQAVIAGNFVFVSGTTGVDIRTGQLAVGGYDAQITQAYTNIKTILEDVGSSMDKVVKITMFMVAGSDPDFSISNRAYASFFPNVTPARSGPQVMPFPGGILISIECIAII